MERDGAAEGLTVGEGPRLKHADADSLRARLRTATCASDRPDVLRQQQTGRGSEVGWRGFQSKQPPHVYFLDVIFINKPETLQ